MFRILWSEAFYGSISTTIGVVGSFGLVSRSGFYGPRPFMAPISTTIGVVGSFGLVSRSGFYGPRPFMAPFLLQLV